MENVISWATSVCAAALGCSAVLMLAPKGALGKTFRLVVSAVLLVCMVKPIASIALPDWSSWKTLTDPTTSTALDKTVETQLCAQIEQTVADLCLERYGDIVEKVVAVTDISHDDVIYMKHVRVCLKQDAAHKAASVKQYIEQETGLFAEMELSNE